MAMCDNVLLIMPQSAARCSPVGIIKANRIRLKIRRVRFLRLYLCRFLCRFFEMSKQSKPRQKHTRPQKDPRFFDPDIYADWLTGKPKKAAYIPKGRRAPESINIIR